jgi:hypothetical protein
MDSVKNPTKGRRRVRAMLPAAAGSAVLVLLGGCAADDAATRTVTWEPPRGGFATSDLAVAAEALAGRGDARLGHPPRRAETLVFARVETRSRLTTSGSGRVTDSVSRREQATTIYIRP